MKKLIILMVIFLTSVCTFATDAEWGKATRLNYRNIGYDWVGWQTTNIDVNWDYDSNQIIIYSDEKQIIDYWNLKKSYSNGITKYRMNADDTQHNRLIMEIYLYDSGGVFIKMLYSNVEYKYELNYLR